MPIYTKECLEKLRERIDLVDVLSSHMELKKQGASFKGLCPFHDEKTPSFMIQKGDTHYHCFGCGAHGDAIQFLMQHLHLSFSESVETLAEKFNVTLVHASQKEERGVNKAALREALDAATLFFHTYLLQSDEGREALLYLEERGLSLNFLTKFEVGLAPQTPGLLRKVLESKKLKEETLIASGLFSKDGRHDFFRERITFPIRNMTGSVIGFSARKYKEKTQGGKYINTPETPLFKKSRTLFGLNYSREKIVKERKVLVVEGQIDCLKLIEAGFNWSVASLGTAFGEEHVHELHHLGVLQATLIFDGDEAGLQATAKVGNLFQKVGIEVRVVRLPEKEDPDSFLNHFGPEKMREQILKGCDYLTFRFETFSKKFDLKSPAQKTEVVQILCQEIQSWDDPVMVHESLRALSKLAHIPEDVMGVGIPPPQSIYRRHSLMEKKEIDPDRVLELDLLRWMILVEDEKIIKKVLGYLKPEHFSIPVCRQLFESYEQAYLNHEPRDLLALLIHVDEEEGARAMDEILNKKIKLERAELHTLETIQKLLDRKWLQERERIKKEIDSGGKTEEEVMGLLKRFDQLKDQRVKVI